MSTNNGKDLKKGPHTTRHQQEASDILDEIDISDSGMQDRYGGDGDIGPLTSPGENRPTVPKNNSTPNASLRKTRK